MKPLIFNNQSVPVGITTQPQTPLSGPSTGSLFQDPLRKEQNKIKPPIRINGGFKHEPEPESSSGRIKHQEQKSKPDDTKASLKDEKISGNKHGHSRKSSHDRKHRQSKSPSHKKSNRSSTENDMSRASTSHSRVENCETVRNTQVNHLNNNNHRKSNEHHKSLEDLTSKTKSTPPNSSSVGKVDTPPEGGVISFDRKSDSKSSKKGQDKAVTHKTSNKLKNLTIPPKVSLLLFLGLLNLNF